jgi:hypothetical protein
MSNNKDDGLLDLDRNENYLRKLKNNINSNSNNAPQVSVNSLIDKIHKVNRNEMSRRESKLKPRLDDNVGIISSNNATSKRNKKHRRRNDKFLHRRPTKPEDYELFMNLKDNQKPQNNPQQSIDYYDCTTFG